MFRLLFVSLLCTHLILFITQIACWIVKHIIVWQHSLIFYRQIYYCDKICTVARISCPYVVFHIILPYYCVVASIMCFHAFLQLCNKFCIVVWILFFFEIVFFRNNKIVVCVYLFNIFCLLFVVLHFNIAVCICFLSRLFLYFLCCFHSLHHFLWLTTALLWLWLYLFFDDGFLRLCILIRRTV